MEVEKIKKEVKESFLVTLLLITFAVVLCINPDNFINIAMNVLGYLGILIGIVEIFWYLKKGDKNSNFLKNGGIYVLLGVVVILKASLLQTVFTLLLGSYILIQNMTRIDTSLKIKEEKQTTWLIVLALSIINIILGFILIHNPLILSDKLNISIAGLVLFSQISIILENVLLLLKLKKCKE